MMVTIYMNGQNKTNQITDWRIWNKNESNRLMLTVDFPSGKKWTMPLTECQIEPYRELGSDFLLCENNYSSEIEQAVEYGDQFIVVKYPKNEKLYVMKSENVSLKPKLNLKNEKLFQYFTQVTAERISTANNNTEKVIAENVQRQLQRIIPSSDNALSAYCYAKNEARELPKNFIFPFGINENQLNAVLSAFTSQISIIEGPPGTGKTQTILNIVANILLKNEKVAIVSNNNEAVKNVYEKLDKENLGYLIAELGNTDNKEKFFSNLRTIPKESKSMDIEIESVQATFERLKKNLHAKNAAATLVTEIKEFEIEKDYLKNWHSEHPSVKLIDLKKYKLSPKKITDLIVYIEYLSNKHVSFAERFKLILNFRIFKTAFLNDLSERLNVIYTLQLYYYDKQIGDRKKELHKLENMLKTAHFDDTLATLKKDSLLFLKQHLAKNIKNRKINFTAKDYRSKKNFQEFLYQFPIVGSSTHSIVNSIAEGYKFDYLIIDEASQQDIVPGILSLGCTKNIIIVGDRKQLPHIPKDSQIECPSEYYDCSKYSLLDSFTKIFENKVPLTLLKEHYRCHPKIIQFCNQQFYNNQLIPMTTDHGEQAIEVITTAKGNHTRGYANLREIDSLLAVRHSEEKNVGFVTPYNAQVNLAEKYLPQEFINKTVHKTQGREYNEVIFSTVLDKKKLHRANQSFVDQAPLVNVAVSRAAKRFTLITGNDVFDKESNIAALIRYIKYYAESDFIHDSPVISAFDLLYNDYDASLEKLYKRLSYSNAEYKSEKIVDVLLKDLLIQEEFNLLVSHKQVYLAQLVSVENNLFTQRELEFINQKASCDFVLYYRIGKNPLCVVEVDGRSHEKDVRKERDGQKDSILKKSGIPLLRLKTNEANIELKLKKFIHSCVSGNDTT